MSRVEENNKVIDDIEFMCEHREDAMSENTKIDRGSSAEREDE